MYSDTAIHFRNPFTSGPHHHAAHYNYDDSPDSPLSRVPLSRQPITPPPDMYTVAPSYQSSHYQEHGYRYGERAAAPMSYPTSYTSGAYSSDSRYTQQRQYQPTTHGNRPPSPVSQPVTSVPAASIPQQRRESQSNASAIAPSLQIPRSINDSQGSLSDLAAQITCLFWFESNGTLEQAETTGVPTRPLDIDAVPNTGFRKFVTTMLSTTQVAQNVILLALLFVYRLKKLNPSVKGKPGSEFRLLTVALMLGNKFLDDNTYTNKTWAEVSGISVAEVHIMEVEFLSNMKYGLYTSAAEWAQWQVKLGKFASFVDQAMKLQGATSTMTPNTTARLPLPPTLPSPPSSNQASPPYTGNSKLNNYPHPYAVSASSHGPTPRPSPLAPLPELDMRNSRKRSIDDYDAEPAPKRLNVNPASDPALYSSNFAVASNTQNHSAQQLPRMTLPSLPMPQDHTIQANHGSQAQPHLPTQLPPLNNYSTRLMNASYLPPNTWSQGPTLPAPVSQLSQPTSQIHSTQQSRHQSPYPGSANVSPTNGLANTASQLSPSYYLAQRNSPYKPIRGVATLLVPPPTQAQQPQNVGNEQMHYQPLGRPIQDRQQGRLPYVLQNQWFDGQHQHPVTPTVQWSSYFNPQQQQQQQLAPPHYG